MIAHIPIFLLLTPLLSALAISIVKLFTKTNIFIKIITGIGTILPFYFLILIFHKLSDGIIEYNIGGWSTPFTITLIIDGFSFTMLLITSIIIFLSYIYSLGYLKKTDGKFYFFFLIMIVGLYGIFLSGDIFNLYVFFELTVISSYILITFGDKKASLKASFQYLIIGSLASFFFLFGIGLIYIKTGLLNIESLSMNINIIDNKTQIVIISLFIGAIGIKAAIVPFHSWLVSAHSTAPTPISAILSGITVKAGVYIFIRIFTLGCFTLENLNEILIILGAITALGGVIGALVEWDIKRLIAYHTISQMGFIIVGIGTLSYIGIVGGIYHIVNHAIFKSLLFLCAGSIIFRTGSKDIRDHGIKKTMPITLITYIIAVLAISGVTPFNGSVSKYLIEQSIYAYQFVWIILICASIGTVVTFLKILYYSFIKTSIKNPNNNYQEVPISMQIPMIILAFLCILLGILPNLWIDTFISPASTCVLGQISNIESNFFEPVYILKEWIIVGLGLVALKIIIFRKKDIDKLRGFFSKFDMNICIFIMIFSITFILLLLTIS